MIPLIGILAVLGPPDGSSRKEATHQCRSCEGHGFDPWLGKIRWRRVWQPTPSCLETPRGQRSLACYRPWGQKESDTTERLSTAQHITQGLLEQCSCLFIIF